MKRIGWILGAVAGLGAGCGSSSGTPDNGGAAVDQTGGSGGAAAGSPGAVGGAGGAGGSLAGGGSGGMSSTAGGSAGSVGLGGSTSTGGGGDSVMPCATTGGEITTLPSCSSPASNLVDVGPGCVPTVDGTLHAAEWADSTCFVVGNGDMTINIKYAGDTLYLATSGQPTCGCPFFLEFDPTASASLDADDFAIGLFDDPSGVDGDRFDLMSNGSAFTMGTAPAANGIVTRCLGMNPTPIRYEISVPLASVGVVAAGQSHTFGLGILHNGVGWPAGLMQDTGGVLYSSDTPAFGKVSSSSSWK